MSRHLQASEVLFCVCPQEFSSVGLLRLHSGSSVLQHTFVWGGRDKYMYSGVLNCGEGQTSPTKPVFEAARSPVLTDPSTKIHIFTA